MEGHKTKPGRNWRVLLTEVGIIVLGVGIALAAQQAVDWLNWRGQVAEAKEVIASEMARNISYGIERLARARCANSRLKAVEKIVDDAARTGMLPPVGGVGGTLMRPWSSGAWDSVVASQTAAHFPRQQLAVLSLVYMRVQRVENWNRQEAEAWTVLSTLAGAGRRFDPAYETELRKALQLVEYLDYAITTTSERMIAQAESQNLAFNADDRNLMAAAMKDTRFRGLCAPLSAKPPAGRDAALDERFSRWEAFQKSLPYGQPEH